MIIQGDEYKLELKLHQGDTEITPGLISGMVVQIDDKKYNYPEDITYGNNTWYVQLTQGQTLNMNSVAKIQAQIELVSGDIVNTETKSIKVGESLIKEIFE